MILLLVCTVFTLYGIGMQPAVQLRAAWYSSKSLYAVFAGVVAIIMGCAAKGTLSSGQATVVTHKGQ
jgi:hypothetical protein